MFPRNLLFFLFCLAGLCAGAQGPAGNPFELVFRLPKTAVIDEKGEVVAVVKNPFDVVTHRQPGISESIDERVSEPFQAARMLPTGDTLQPVTFFVVLVIMLAFFAFSIAANRSVVGKAWRSFLNDNALTVAQREASGLVGNAPYFLLYGNFLLNAGIFIFLITRYFKGGTFNNLYFLLICIGVSCGLFLAKHALLNAMATLFPVKNEVKRYNFLITVFNCVLGLFLVPFNLLIAFSREYEPFVVFWTLGLAFIFYVYRSARSSSIGSKFLSGNVFHFLLYLCTAELAPVVIMIKLAMLQTA